MPGPIESVEQVNSPKKVRNFFLESMNPTSGKLVGIDLGYQLMNRPEYWSTMGVHGLRWPGMWGFRTLGAGLKPPFKAYGENPGAISRMANFVINRPIGWAFRTIGDAVGKNAYGAKLTQFGGYVGQDFGIVGALQKSGMQRTGSFFKGLFAGTKSGFGGVAWGLPTTVTEGSSLSVTREMMSNIADDVGKFTAEQGFFRSLTKKGFIQTRAGAFQMSAKKLGLVRGTEGFKQFRGAFMKNFGRGMFVSGRLAAAGSVIGNVMLVSTALKWGLSQAITGSANILRSIDDMRLRSGQGMFGSGTVPEGYRTAQATTMRQRALNELRTARVGSKTFLGNEASMYSD